MDQNKKIDLEATSVVVPGEVYAAVIDYLVKKFTYADIVMVVNELNKNAYTVDNSVVEKYNPKNESEPLEAVPVETEKKIKK